MTTNTTKETHKVQNCSRDKEKPLYDLCCIGYITRDTNISPKSTVNMPGGTAFYFAEAIKHLNKERFLLVTALGEADMHIVEQQKKDGIEIIALPSKNTLCFENIYSKNQNERKQRVTAQADPFQTKDLSEIKAHIVHLGTLTASDFSSEVIKSLAQSSVISADVQGFLRKIENQKVFPVDWSEKEEVLKYIDILKANEAEMEVLTQCQDPHEAAKKIAKWGVKEVLITLGDKGSLIYVNDTFYEIPAYPTPQVIDATGCGDTYMVGYLYMRNKGASYEEAGKFAAAMCTIKLQSHGPFNATEKDIWKIIEMKG